LVLEVIGSGSGENIIKWLTSVSSNAKTLKVERYNLKLTFESQVHAIKEYKQNLHTVVRFSSESSFKNTVTRMLTGVTYTKFKRLRGKYFQHNQHNALVARKLSEDLYAQMLSLKDLSTYLTTVDFDISWNSTGKITGISNIQVFMYDKVGKVSAKELLLYRTTDKVKLEVFVSDVDSGSKSLLDLITEIRRQYGEDSFDYQEHKLLNDADYEKYAKPYGIDLVPAVVINDKKFPNPTESQLRSNIEAAVYSAMVIDGLKLTKLRNNNT
jgi:glutaredoxin